MNPAGLIAGQSVRLALRDRTVVLMMAMFALMVLLSAWLGWQATTTVDRIYTDAAAFLASAGKEVPDNPVLDRSPLTLMRNLSVYVTLLGALSAIVIGNQLVASDRAAGVMPLIGSRLSGRFGYANGKVTALAGLVAGLVGGAALVSAATLAVLPAIVVTHAQWLHLAEFFALSAIYMMIFGLIALWSAAIAPAQSVGLLIPVALWLTITFILPALTLNLTPTAVLNPISALATPPASGFFRGTGWLLGPLSLTEIYGATAAGLLDFRPVNWVARSMLPAALSLGLWLALCLTLALRALANLSLATGCHDE